MRSPFNKMMRTFVVGLAALAIFQNGAWMSGDVMQSRWYRDLAALTPFYDVDVFGAEVTIAGLVTAGEMKKRRCQFNDLRGFVVFFDGPKIRVIVNTDVEDAKGVTGNRTPSRDAQTWGPWLLEYPTDSPRPDGWQIYAGHWCPVIDEQTGEPVMNTVTGEPVTTYETNLFARGVWPAQN